MNVLRARMVALSMALLMLSLAGVGATQTEIMPREERWTTGTSCVDSVTSASCAGDSRACFMLCGICTTPLLRLGAGGSSVHAYCTTSGTRSAGEDGEKGATPPAELFPPSADTAAKVLTQAVLNSSAVQGFYWNQKNASDCLLFLFQHMPRRDLLLLFSDTYRFMMFLNDHVRWALHTRVAGRIWSEVPWEIFLQYVLPYSVLDEPRDVWYRWRPRYNRLFMDAVGANATSLWAMFHVLVEMIPHAQPQGALAVDDIAVNGMPISWVSESSPGILSPSQVGAFGGSCTGTAIVLALAARAVGLPARLTGCSQNIPNDDHHWVEFYDPAVPSPFGDGWHTKEGVSKGNAGGPWDGVSGPMGSCLQNLKPQNTYNTIWASSWNSAVFLPTLWSMDTPFNHKWQWKGGLNRCGAYCTAWGCGPNRTTFYTQAECGPDQ